MEYLQEDQSRKNFAISVCFSSRMIIFGAFMMCAPYD